MGKFAGTPKGGWSGKDWDVEKMLIGADRVAMEKGVTIGFVNRAAQNGKVKAFFVTDRYGCFREFLFRPRDVGAWKVPENEARRKRKAIDAVALKVLAESGG